ncbi:MAG: phosphatidylserine decarboxylase family protein [Chitinophagaceae bacterium]|nr:phosphatidylserine decarboxylase family protein [Chitinophagaceae bacterium]
MRIHKEGTATLLLMAVILIIINGMLMMLLPIPVWMLVALIILTISFYLFLISFFRNPKRNTIINANEIIAPADGKVVVIEETMEMEFFNAPRRQLSIFMSPANVHVNRNPISGEVKYVKHHHGKFLVAWHPKSSTDNERTTVVIANDKIELLMRQIAGILARRIVNYLNVQDTVHQGEEFGFIKFGSRVDLFLPLDAKIKVQLNQDVRGGETVIASIS